MAFFLISTDHLEDRIWFKDDEDFAAGMNYVAVVAATVDVSVLSFILMSNHVHFFLECSAEDAKKYIDLYKSKYSRYCKKKYGTEGHLKRVGVDIKEIKWAPESLEQVSAYVIMNPVAANICLSPEMYPWGSANCFFNTDNKTCRRLEEMSGREQIRLLHSNVKLNQKYEVCDMGYILPRSFVKVKFMESVFQTPKRMRYFLNNSSKAKTLRERKLTEAVSLSDQTLILAVKDICRSMFDKYDASALDREQIKTVARHLRRCFRADANQISRVLGLSYAESAAILDSF